MFSYLRAILFITLVACVLHITPKVSAEEQAPPASCTVSGRVVNQTTGDGVRNATVKMTDSGSAPEGLTSIWYQMVGISNTNNSAESKYSVETSYDGGFCFASPQPGVYSLSASKPGYLDSTFITDGPFVEIGPSRGQIPTVSLAIAPLSGVAGSVLDGAGDPATNFNVVAVKRAEVQGRVVFMPIQGSQSNELGEFRIGKLVPGTYYLYAQPLPSSAGGETVSFARTYYPASLTLADATPIMVGVGDDLTGVVVHLQSVPTSHVAGRVLGPPDVWIGATAELRHAEEDPLIMLYGAGNLAADGSFDFADVEPGRYLLTVRSVRGGGQRLIDVNSSDVRADVQFVPNVTLRGRWAIDAGGTGSVPVASIDLVAADAVVGPSYAAHVDSAGTFSATGIFPGRYSLKVSLISGAYLKRLKLDGKDCLTGEIDLTAGKSPEIEITIARGTATISGEVKEPAQANAQTGGHKQSRLVLLPKPGRIDGTDIRFAASDANGHFRFANLAPGQYQVFALASSGVGIIQNPRLLHELASGFGKEISVRGAGEAESIDLTAISDEATTTFIRSDRGK